MKELLTKLGLSDKEITLFVALYSQRRATPAILSEQTKLNRSTVYVLLAELCQKGYVAEDLSALKQTFVALDPDELLGLIPKMELELKEKEKNMRQLVTSLKEQLDSGEIHIPKILYIREDQIEQHLYARTPIWNKSIKEGGRDIVGYYDHTFVDLYHGWIDWYYQQPSSKDINLRLLTNESAFEKDVMTKKAYAKRNILFWDGIGNITYSTWIYGDYSLLVNTHTHPFSLIEIFDKNYAQSQAQIFEALWVEAVKENKG